MRIEDEDEDEDEDEVEGEVAEDDGGGEEEEFAFKARRVPVLGGRRDLGWRGFP